MRFNAFSLSLIVREAQRLRIVLPSGAQQFLDIAATTNAQERAEWLELMLNDVIPESIKSARLQRDDFLKGEGARDIPLEVKLRNIDNSIALFALMSKLAAQKQEGVEG